MTINWTTDERVCEFVSWYFEPSLPQKTTSGLKQTSICLLFTLHTSHQTTNSSKTTKSFLTQIYISNKTCTNIKHKIFKELVPLVLPPLKKHIRPGHAGIVDHSVDLSIPDFFFLSIKTEGTEAIKEKKLYKCISANTSAIWQHAAHTTNQLTSPSC